MRPAHLLTILLACLPAPAAGQSVPTNAADLRRALDPVVKQLAPPGGCRLSGRFHYQGAGDEISYRAEIP